MVVEIAELFGGLEQPRFAIGDHRRCKRERLTRAADLIQTIRGRQQWIASLQPLRVLLVAAEATRHPSRADHQGHETPEESQSDTHDDREEAEPVCGLVGRSQLAQARVLFRVKLVVHRTDLIHHGIASIEEDVGNAGPIWRAFP